jgi:hypothetical protein
MLTAGPAVVALICCAATEAHAHALYAQAKLEGGQILIEARFEGDEPAEKAKVYLIDAMGDKMLRGRTGSDGTLRFDAPSPGKYEVLIDAGAGHQAKVALTITEKMLRTPTSAPFLISEGRSIEEAKSGRWWKIGIGLAAIGGFAVVLMIVARRHKAAAGPSAT